VVEWVEVTAVAMVAVAERVDTEAATAARKVVDRSTVSQQRRPDTRSGVHAALRRTMEVCRCSLVLCVHRQTKMLTELLHVSALRLA